MRAYDLKLQRRGKQAAAPDRIGPSSQQGLEFVVDKEGDWASGVKIATVESGKRVYAN